MQTIAQAIGYAWMAVVAGLLLFVLVDEVAKRVRIRTREMNRAQRRHPSSQDRPLFRVVSGVDR